MISEDRAKKYCSEDISLIENYEQAINDDTQTWDCHHRGEILPCGRYTVNDLKKFNLYYDRPANELIFLTHSDHQLLHNKGKPHSEQTRKKLSVARKGRIWWNNGLKTVMAFKCLGPEWSRGRLPPN